MANIEVVDGAGVAREFKATGTGLTGDPFIPEHAVDSIVPGTAAANLGKAEDAAHVSGDTGVLALGVRKDTATALAGTDGDYQPPIFDASGRQHVNVGNTVTVDSELTTADLDTGAGTDTRAVVGLVIAESGGALLVGSAHPLPVDIGGASVTIGSGVEVSGDVAHDGVDSGKPVKIGGYAKAAAPTNVSADGDRVNAWFDLAGRLAVQDGGGNLSVDDGGGNLSIDDGGGSITVDGSVTVSGSVTADTELPAAAALADAESNPSAPAVGSHLLAWNGASWDRVRVASKGYDMSAVSITSIATVATPTSGKKWRLMSGTFSVSAACSVLFEDNAGGTTVFRTPKLLADTPYSFDLGGGVLSGSANNVLKATASAAAAITGTLRVTEE